MLDKMIVEIFKNREWLVDNFQDLVIGSKFRMRHPHTKEIFVGDDNRTEFVVISKPYTNEDGIETVDILPAWKYTGMGICDKKDTEED